MQGKLVPIITSLLFDDSEPGPPPANDSIFESNPEATRFLNQATFGARASDVASVADDDYSKWLLAEFAKRPSLLMPHVNYFDSLKNNEEAEGFQFTSTTFGFWKNSIAGADQLRQRMSFALSQILVVSNFSCEGLADVPAAVGTYIDILNNNAFGNYRDILEAITYSPTMGLFLTFMGNQKENPATGRRPDENYAREILQLFSIGLIRLNMDGTPVLDNSDNTIETYDNDDITGLAKVFTGLNRADGEEFDFDEYYAETFLSPMQINESQHSTSAKSFLGLTIPANTRARESIRRALDHIMAHQNVAPFISRQLIQRFTTSHPQPAYIERVATAFETGRYTLPDSTIVGTGRKGDLKATIAAILLDSSVRSATALNDPTFGKVREPILRLTQWARAFRASSITPEFTPEIWNTNTAEELDQHPYRAKSVFNFYRPGYVAPSTLTGQSSLTMPEMQITNATSIWGYTNFIMTFITESNTEESVPELANDFDELGVNLNANRRSSSFRANYGPELALASNPQALVDRLDFKLTAGLASSGMKEAIVDVIEGIEIEDDVQEALRYRVHTAIGLFMSAADYLVQR
ncbi:MAG: DUF1800 family protein [Pseudomonadota bacterium]